MARARRTCGNDVVEIEVSDVALVLAILGVAAAATAGAWFVTRNPETLRQLAEVAKESGARLLNDGRPVLG